MSVVVSLRIPKELKLRLEELGIDWRREVREYLEKRVREEAKKVFLEKARELRKSIGRRGTPGAEIIREFRESR